MLDFIQNEIFGMKWLNRLIGSLLNACGLDTESKLGGSLQFFIYDTLKIMVLLGFLIFVITYIQSYFPPERTKKILGRFHGIGANCIAALLGNCYAVLLLFVNTSVHGLYKRGTSSGSDVLVSYILANGGPRLPCSSYEHIRLEGGCYLRDIGTCYRSRRRYAYRKAPP